MWIWRRMLKIKWTDKITNELVWTTVGEERSLLHTFRKIDKVNGSSTYWNDNLLPDAIEGRVDEKKMRCGQRIKMLDNLKRNDTYSAILRKLKTEETGGRERQLTTMADLSTTETNDRESIANTVVLMVYVELFKQKRMSDCKIQKIIYTFLGP